jgi:hypothetical protein
MAASKQTITQTITLAPEQIQDLAGKLSTLRHNVNNHLALIVAATELMRRKPDQAARFVGALFDPPERITKEIQTFTHQLEKILLIPPNRPPGTQLNREDGVCVP